MEIDELPENHERLLKKREALRDEHGRFEQHGTGLINKREEIKVEVIKNKKGRGGLRAGAGRPRGSKNKMAILTALDELGGVVYLKKLAIENSSAFAGLLGKVLPTTLQASDSSGGTKTKLTFERIIVWPDGRREIQGKTPKQLPAPASHELPSSNEIIASGYEGEDESST